MSLAHFDLIVVALRAAKLDSLESALERAVEDEAAALAEGSLGRSGSRRAINIAQEQAQEFFGEEIFHAVRLRGSLPPLTPDQILSLRRTPTVWAIATKMIEAGIRLERTP